MWVAIVVLVPETYRKIEPLSLINKYTNMRSKPMND